LAFSSTEKTIGSGRALLWPDSPESGAGLARARPKTGRAPDSGESGHNKQPVRLSDDVVFNRSTGESSDTANKDLPPQQVELINAVTGLGKPTIAVVSMGGPYALASVIDKLPAVLTDYYGGPHQASALADAIFGVTNPGGKLPFTLPRHVGQVPIHYAQKWGSGYRRTKEDIHKGYLDI